jgi:hypothetical protein
MMMHVLTNFNPLNAKLNPICQLLALLGAHPILYVSRIRVKIKGVLINSASQCVVCFYVKSKVQYPRVSLGAFVNL